MQLKKILSVLAMFFFAVVLCASTSVEDVTVPTPVEESSVSEVSSIASVQSFNGCWNFYFIPNSHTFNCGYCTWYSIEAVHDGSSNRTMYIQERDANNNDLYEHTVTIPPNQTYTFTNSSPSTGTAKIIVTLPGAAVVFGTICLATL